MKYPRARLLLFSKAPDPGKVKTRLIPLLGDVAARDLYAQLIHDSLKLCTSVALCPVDLWCSPSTDHAFFRQCQQQYPVELHTQTGGDLGMGMSNALSTALQDADAAILIGADCPTLSESDLNEALDALYGGADVVIGPADDGGYYLIGMRTHQGSLFHDIPWSTSNVLPMTRQRIKELGLVSVDLPWRKDLDTPNDYAVYISGANF